ncbi:MAG TPA: PEP-CTERM sorting domain-containing protein [Tepidisphaeraceae bacterium]
MLSNMRSFARVSLAGVLAASAMTLLSSAQASKADATFTVDPATITDAYMNVSDLPSAGGAYEFGQGWGFSDLAASFSGNVLTLSPNTSIDRDVPTSTYWWQDASGTSAGNKIMAASAYAEDDNYAGGTVTFTGDVLSNTLVSPYTSVAFIDDFSPSYSLLNSITLPLTPGVFSINLPIGAGDNLQYGFVTTGPDARLADVSGLGNAQITAVPEPASFGLLALGGLAALRRKR